MTVKFRRIERFFLGLFWVAGYSLLVAIAIGLVHGTLSWAFDPGGLGAPGLLSRLRDVQWPVYVAAVETGLVGAYLFSFFRRRIAAIRRGGKMRKENASGPSKGI